MCEVHLFYSKSVKEKTKYSLKSVAAQQIFASWTRKEPGSKCCTESVYCNPSVAGGCSSTNTHTCTVSVTLVITDLQIKMPKEQKCQIIFLEQVTGWGSYQLKSLWVFTCDVTVRTSKPFSCNGAKNKESKPACLWDEDSNFLEALAHITRRSNSWCWPYL